MPEISVLIPYYNDELYLSESICSVLNQTYENFELILINHSCTDSSKKIAHSFTDKRIIHIDLPRNEGAGGGCIFDVFFNKAKGRFLKLFCADDIMLDNCLETEIDFIKNNASDIIFSDMKFISPKGRSLLFTWSQRVKDFSFFDTSLDILKKYSENKQFLPFSTVMFKKELFSDLQIDYSYILAFDQTLWLSAAARNKKFGFIPKTLVLYRHHSGQMCGRNAKPLIMSSFENINKYQLFFSIADYILLKSFISSSSYLDMITEKDKDLFSLLIAIEFLKSKDNCYKAISGYQYIHDFLQNPQLRQKAMKKLNFGIKEFRELYRTNDVLLPITLEKNSKISFLGLISDYIISKI